TDAAIKAMTDAGVSMDDIQTLSYNINPHYEYTGSVCTSNGYCPPSKSVITGYDVSQTVQVKVRDLSKAGTLLAAVGSLGVQNVDSLQFSIDKPEAIQNQARAKAITAAQTKADTLARELGVHIVRVVNFSENGGGVVSPIMYSAKAMNIASDVAVAPNIPAGQQKITSDVSITYEIR
ncbi:MAG: SIMPL domain-containing protein, partial [bacterium]